MSDILNEFVYHYRHKFMGHFATSMGHPEVIDKISERGYTTGIEDFSELDEAIEDEGVVRFCRVVGIKEIGYEQKMGFK